VSAVVIPLKIRRGSFAAQIAIDALIIHIELAYDVLRVLVFYVSHGGGGVAGKCISHRPVFSITYLSR
jgi:hypothetical protein